MNLCVLLVTFFFAATVLAQEPPLVLSPGVCEYTVTVADATNAANYSDTRVLHVPAPGDPQYSSAIPHGIVHVQRYTCDALGTNRECWIYTPPGYEESGKNYPLLVLQHAGADTQKTWVAKGRVDWLLDELIAVGRARPMVVLMLDGHPHGEPAYLNPETKEAAMNNIKREWFEDAIPLVEKNYRIEKSRELRALAGPSVGGGQVISLGLSNLDRFAWIGIFSAGHDIPEFYQSVLDNPAMVNDRLKLFWISCAQDDKEFANNEKFVTMLDSKGIHHEWYPTPGAHKWPIWRRDLGEYLTRVFQTTSVERRE
ncbi:MAG: alpha/beta hydrolase-fold protein [Verrucomicrobiae bacterium]